MRSRSLDGDPARNQSGRSRGIAAADCTARTAREMTPPATQSLRSGTHGSRRRRRRQAPPPLRGSGLDRLLSGGVRSTDRTPAGDGGVARGRGRRVRPLDAAARPTRGGVRRRLEHHAPTARGLRRRGNVPRVLGGGERVVWPAGVMRWPDGRWSRRRCGPRGCHSDVAPTLYAGGSVHARRSSRVERRCRATQRAQAARAARGARDPGADAAAAAGHARLRGSGAASSNSAPRARALVVDRLREHRPRCARARGREHARAAARVAWFQPHCIRATAPGARVRRRARSRTAVVTEDLPARERADDTKGSPGPSRRAPPPARAGKSAVAWMPDFDRPSASASELREGAPC